MSFNDIRNKYIKEATDVEQPSTNILDQMPSYNSYDTKVLIDTLNIEYDEQLLLNRILRNENTEEQSKKIKDFVNNYYNNVNKQVVSLADVSGKLKNICKENKTLELEKEDFQELINSPECNEIAEQLRKIKSMKQDILHFLDMAGLRVQQ